MKGYAQNVRHAENVLTNIYTEIVPKTEIKKAPKRVQEMERILVVKVEKISVTQYVTRKTNKQHKEKKQKSRKNNAKKILVPEMQVSNLGPINWSDYHWFLQRLYDVQPEYQQHLESGKIKQRNICEFIADEQKYQYIANSLNSVVGKFEEYKHSGIIAIGLLALPIFSFLRQKLLQEQRRQNEAILEKLIYVDE
eukprot:TRINITY_DN16884_c0_g1_i4.p2 TRINITY_DN16884_c0_g1~~TRINITY_DN16884_c0_g1_i4.p2  ORF type:complete len:195 (+),score=13.66 TRINITY_DN16884_c0_g1_i4:663-1247(+)